MPQCLHCGASSTDQAAFCQHCGASLSHVGADDGKATNAAPTNAGKIGGASGFGPPGDELPIPENLAGVVAYVTIFPAIVFLLLEPFNRNLFVRFHAFQHLFLWVAGFAIAIAAGVLGAVLQLIPFMRVLVFPLAGLISLAWFFLWVLLVVKAYQHEFFKLPIIGDLAEQQAGA
jgi:uncharacterized membrane protein